MNFDGGLGETADGIPVVNWQDPFTITTPLDVPLDGPAGASVMYFSYQELTPSGASGGGGLALGGAILFRVVYGPDGHLQGISQAIGGQILPDDTAGASAAIPPSGGSSCGPFGMAPSQHGGVIFTFGQTHVRFDPVVIPIPPNTPLNIGVSVVANTALNVAVPEVGTYNFAVGALNAIGQLGQGNLVAGGVEGAAVAVQQVLGFGIGSTLHGGAAITGGLITGSLNTLAPDFGGRNCGRKDNGLPFDIWIDPSGTVLAQGGRPITDARVVLERSAARHSAPRAVPTGSSVMSPANRRNPDFTNLLGSFGWDVTAGYYRIVATHARCRPASTLLLAVPPPRVGLTLQVRCSHLPPRLGTRTTATATGIARLHAYTVTVRVRGHHIVGDVVLHNGRQILGTLPVEPTGLARLTISLKPHQRYRLTATYEGSAALAPSNSGMIRLP